MTKTKKRSEKADAILNAALDLFVERGFHGTAVPLIAENAGVSAGTIYRHFDSKEHLVNALYRHWKMQVSQEVLNDFPFHAPPRQQFAAYWQRTINFGRNHPNAMAFLELHHHAAYLDDESNALEAQVRGTAATLVHELKTAGVVKDAPVQVLLALVHGAMVGLFKASSVGWFELTDDVSTTAETACWEAIRL